jgi:hypothetical protein
MAHSVHIRGKHCPSHHCYWQALVLIVQLHLQRLLQVQMHRHRMQFFRPLHYYYHHRRRHHHKHLAFLIFCAQYLRITMPTCKTSPPPGQDIAEYLDRLKDIAQQLNATNDKKLAIERLDMMIDAIKAAVKKTNPDISF